MESLNSGVYKPRGTKTCIPGEVGGAGVPGADISDVTSFLHLIGSLEMFRFFYLFIFKPFTYAQVDVKSELNCNGRQNYNVLL